MRYQVTVHTSIQHVPFTDTVDDIGHRVQYVETQSPGHMGLLIIRGNDRAELAMTAFIAHRSQMPEIAARGCIRSRDYLDNHVDAEIANCATAKEVGAVVECIAHWTEMVTPNGAGDCTFTL